LSLTLRREKKRWETSLLSKTARGKMAAVASTTLLCVAAAGQCEASMSVAVITAMFLAASRRRLSPKAACFVQVPLQSSRNQEAAQMQMITRRVNEGLVIENDIHVTVLDICQDYVRLAISSPNNSPPYREETLYWEEASRPTAAESAPELMLQ
jgi:carbon storage regulator CsrA